MDRKVYIYALKNKELEEIRYVGKTTRPKFRLKEHLNEKVRKFSYHKLNWINESKRNNKEIELIIIEEVNESNWQDKEKFYIDYYRVNGHRLTNHLEGGISPQMFKYNLNYSEAKEIVNKLKIKTVLEWRNKSKNNELPIEIPKRPDLYYLENGWVSWTNWLGLEIVSNKNKIFLNYEEAKLFVNDLKLISNNDWRKYCKSGLKPKNIPSNPDSFYSKNGWVSWTDWLGYKEQNLKKQETYLNYADAKEYVSKLNLKTHNEWVLFSKTDRPKNIPANPWKYYKEWNGIKEFLN